MAAGLLALWAVLLLVLPGAAAAEAEAGFELTPPRLSLAEGDVHFWRPGAEDWQPALLNTSMAAGDVLSTGSGARLELQVGPRAWVRAGEASDLELSALEPDFLELRLADGDAALDLRELAPGQTLSLVTPHAALRVEQAGYYRIQVDDGATRFASHRGGHGLVTPEGAPSIALGAHEAIAVIAGTPARVERGPAPELDGWDRWNYARTTHQLESESARYLPAGVYGARDLDDHGDWRHVPTYGAVWVPRHVPVGWVPYSSGRWVAHPLYGWTWVDAAPWGWAPFHYGRWVYASGFWAWSPGPVVVRPVWAPALVAFFGVRGPSFSISVGSPSFAWVALGWGEPLIPWWGPVRFRTVPYWAGWGGPRVVNRVVVKPRTLVQVNQIRVYQNVHVHRAVVAVDGRHFGRRAVSHAHRSHVDARHIQPLRAELPRHRVHARHADVRRPPARGASPELRLRGAPTVERRSAGRPDASSRRFTTSREGAQAAPVARAERRSAPRAASRLEGASPRVQRPPARGAEARRLEAGSRRSAPAAREAGQVARPPARGGASPRAEAPSSERPRARAGAGAVERARPQSPSAAAQHPPARAGQGELRGLRSAGGLERPAARTTRAQPSADTGARVERPRAQAPEARPSLRPRTEAQRPTTSLRQASPAPPRGTVDQARSRARATQARPSGAPREQAQGPAASPRQAAPAPQRSAVGQGRVASPQPAARAPSSGAARAERPARERTRAVAPSAGQAVTPRAERGRPASGAGAAAASGASQLLRSGVGRGGDAPRVGGAPQGGTPRGSLSRSQGGSQRGGVASSRGGRAGR